MKAFVEKHPFISFVVIAFGWTWPLAALIEVSLVFPLLALFGPCVAAVIVLVVIRGRAGLVELGSKFRLSSALVPWCIVAALLPLALLLPLWILHACWWGRIGFELGELSLLSVALAVLIVGEEVGWRGFLLPLMLQRHAPLTGSVIVGLVWAIWHLPNFLLPNYPHRGLPFSAFVLMTVSYSVLLTWLYLKTAGSLLVAVLFHAALNLFSLGGVEPSRQYWLKAVVYAAAALCVCGVMRKYCVRRGVSVTAA